MFKRIHLLWGDKGLGLGFGRTDDWVICPGSKEKVVELYHEKS